MRHAKSDWSNGQLGDHARPLNARGLRTAPAMGNFLAKQGVAPELVLCSTANRARQTLDLVMPAFDQAPKVSYDDSLYLAAPPHLSQRIGGVDASIKRLMIVGHNPGLSMLAMYLAGEDLELPTAAAVRLVSSEIQSWQEGIQPAAWSSTTFWKPREVLELSSSSE